MHRLLIAAVTEAKSHVDDRKNLDNRLLWRVVQLWGRWFSIYALFGVIYALAYGLDDSALGLATGSEFRLKVCFVVSAVLGATLTFTKSYGDVIDGVDQADNGAITANAWQGSFGGSFICTFGILVAVFALLTLFGFDVTLAD